MVASHKKVGSSDHQPSCELTQGKQASSKTATGNQACVVPNVDGFLKAGLFTVCGYTMYLRHCIDVPQHHWPRC